MSKMVNIDKKYETIENEVSRLYKNKKDGIVSTFLASNKEFEKFSKFDTITNKAKLKLIEEITNAQKSCIYDEKRYKKYEILLNKLSHLPNTNIKKIAIFSFLVVAFLTIFIAYLPLQNIDINLAKNMTISIFTTLSFLAFLLILIIFYASLKSCSNISTIILFLSLLFFISLVFLWFI